MTKRETYLKQLEQRRDVTFVYVVRMGDFVKVGVTNNWPHRLDQLKSGMPIEPEPLMVQRVPTRSGALLIEKYWMNELPSLSRGSWFHVPKVINA